MGIRTVILTVLGRGFIPQFCKRPVTACGVPDTALSDGNASVNKFNQNVFPHFLRSRRGRQAMNDTNKEIIPCIRRGEMMLEKITAVGAASSERRRWTVLNTVVSRGAGDH